MTKKKQPDEVVRNYGRMTIYFRSDEKGLKERIYAELEKRIGRKPNSDDFKGIIRKDLKIK